MGFLKNATIKSTTKRRFHQLIDLAITDIRNNTNPIDRLKLLVITLNMGGSNIVIPDDLIEWQDYLRYLVACMVNEELSYDSTMGTSKDFELMMDTMYLEMKKML